MEEKLSFMSVDRHIQYLQASGFYQLNKNSPKINRSLHNVYMRTVFASFLLYIVQEILKLYQVRNNIDEVMGIMFLLLSYTDFIYKAVVLWKKADQIEEVLDVMKGPIFNQKKPDHQSLLAVTIKNSKRVLRVFNIMGLCTCFLWVLHPTILHIQKNPVSIPVWLPFETDSHFHFYTSIFYVWIQTSWLAFANTTSDVFITSLLEQCRTQISILRLELENLVKNSKKEALISSTFYADILDRRFINIFVHHKEIVKTADRIQHIFGGVIFYLFLISTWILCTSMYSLVNVNIASVEFMSMVLYILCILVEICLYCYFGTLISIESSKLMDSVYAMNWLEVPVKQRKFLIIFMERVKKPIIPMAGSFVPLSNGTFISILRSSYSFYAFLKNSER